MFIHEMMRSARLANFTTSTASGLLCTPLPLLLDEREGEQGVIYGHMAKANPPWKEAPNGDALAIFTGPDAYITPSWYGFEAGASERSFRPGNYTAVHVYGAVEFFEHADRLQQAVTRLGRTSTNGHVAEPQAVTDAPVDSASSGRSFARNRRTSNANSRASTRNER